MLRSQVWSVSDVLARLDKLCEDFESLVDVLVERGVVREDDLETDESSNVDLEEEEENERCVKEAKSLEESKQ